MRRFDPSRVPKPEISLSFHEAQHFLSIDLEIGCGVGQHPLQRSFSHPDRAIIAIEKTVERFTKFETRIRNHGQRPNLFPVHSEAVSVITHFIPEQSLDSIFLLYPNPYPKLKQRNLRWHNRAFMRFLLDRLKPDGTLTLATNVDDYHEEAMEMMQNAWNLVVIEDRKIKTEERPRTHFEKKYLLRGEICWNMIFKKT